jgi:hypothetical protein
MTENFNSHQKAATSQSKKCGNLVKNLDDFVTTRIYIAEKLNVREDTRCLDPATGRRRNGRLTLIMHQSRLICNSEPQKLLLSPDG